MKNPTAVWYEQARPAICRIFRDCFAILGLLRRPTPASRAFFAKLSCSPAPEMRLACQPQWCFSTIANNQKIRIELARIRISLVLACFWSTSQVKLYPIYWRELLESKFKPVRPLGFQRDEIPLAQVWARGAPNVSPAPSNFCLSVCIS